MRAVIVLKESVKTAIRPELSFEGLYENPDTRKKPVFIVPEKQYKFATRLVKVITEQSIQYKIYSIPMYNLRRNIKAASNLFRLEKLNFADAKSRVVIHCKVDNETVEKEKERIDWIIKRYKELTLKERTQIISRYE